LAMPCLPVHGLAVFVCRVMSSTIAAAISNNTLFEQIQSS